MFQENFSMIPLKCRNMRGELYFYVYFFVFFIYLRHKTLNFMDNMHFGIEMTCAD